jgi:ABC-type sugar transport system permease subunit
LARCFWLNLPIGGVVILTLLLTNIPDSTRVTASSLHGLFVSLDLIGFFLFAPVMIMFFLALQYGGTQFPWDSATVIGLFCGSGVGLLVFLAWEYLQGDGAMIPFSIVRERIVWSSCVNVFFITACSVCGGYYLSLYFQAVRDNSPLISGVYYLPVILPQIVMSTVSAVLGKPDSIQFGHFP